MSSKVREAAGLLGFDDDDSLPSKSAEESGAPDSGQLAAAEDFMDAVKDGKPEGVLSALRTLMELMD